MDVNEVYLFISLWLSVLNAPSPSVLRPSDHTHTFIDLTFPLVQETARPGRTQPLDQRQTNEDFVKGRLIFSPPPSITAGGREGRRRRQSLSSSLICLTGWQRWGLNRREDSPCAAFRSPGLKEHRRPGLRGSLETAQKQIKRLFVSSSTLLWL